MASPKYRDYFITINEGASSYEAALDIVKELNTKLYAFIIHDKDIIRNVNEEGEITEIPKRTHKHIVLELANPISFNSMQNKFIGAHIDVVKYKKATYQYLIHNRPNSKEKYQYDANSIISNNLPSVKEAITAEEGLRLFRENEFLRYIAEGIQTPYQFVKAFGLNVYKQYWRAYNEMIVASQTDREMKKDLDLIKQVMLEELPF